MRSFYFKHRPPILDTSSALTDDKGHFLWPGKPLSEAPYNGRYSRMLASLQSERAPNGAESTKSLFWALSVSRPRVPRWRAAESRFTVDMLRKTMNNRDLLSSFLSISFGPLQSSRDA